MKKTLLLILVISGVCSSVIAGGIVTNTNQSAAYVRMLARDASTGIDAVFYNPAGLTLLKDGFHLSLSNQTIWQDRNIKCDYPYLNTSEYKGKVFAPVFPSIYAAYKTGKVVFSAGFNPVGGGGGATFDKGLPSFEIGISDLVPGLVASGVPVNRYSTDIYFEGRSVYWGAQLGVSAELSDNVSVFAGMRYIIANTTYQGHLKDNTLYSDLPIFGEGATSINASDFFAGVQLQATQAATQFASFPAAAVMPDEYATAAGLPLGTTFGQAVAIFTQTAAQAGARKVILANQEADVTQKGTGITPIFGMNFNLLDKKLNIGFKYELPTSMLVKNETKKDVIGGFKTDGTPVTMFPDGQEIRNDIPVLLSVGASYKVTPKFTASLGFHNYFDKSANYGKTNSSGEYINNETIIDNNYFELALGLEYNLTKSLLVSAGYLRAQTGVSDAYQSDLSNSLTSNTGAFGFAYNVNPNIQINLGALYSVYMDDEKTYTHNLGKVPVTVHDTYGKGNLILALGVDLSFGKE